MKRIISVCIVVLLMTTVDVAAQRTVRALELELSVGLATAAKDMPVYGKSRQGVDAAIELRYNFAAAPVDLGLNVSLCSMYRGTSMANVTYSYKFISENLLVTTDYNFFQGRMVSPFVGFGMGVAWSEVNADNTPHGAHFAFMPRVGVELSRHIRVTVAYKIFEKANNHLAISLGYAFGGGRK